MSNWYVCTHDWEVATNDWDSCKNTTNVICKKCKVPGEQDNETGVICWPTT